MLSVGSMSSCPAPGGLGTGVSCQDSIRRCSQRKKSDTLLLGCASLLASVGLGQDLLQLGKLQVGKQQQDDKSKTSYKSWLSCCVGLCRPIFFRYNFFHVFLMLRLILQSIKLKSSQLRPGCILLVSEVLEMLLQHDRSLMGIIKKAHTSLYKVLQMMMYVRVKPSMRSSL